MKSTDDLQEDLQITPLVPVNLCKRHGLQDLADLMRPKTWWCGSSSWGNKTGAVLQPVQCCNGLHPLDHVKRMKAIMDQKKQSYKAKMAYAIPRLVVPCLGPKVSNGLGFNWDLFHWARLPWPNCLRAKILRIALEKIIKLKKNSKRWCPKSV